MRTWGRVKRLQHAIKNKLRKINESFHRKGRWKGVGKKATVKIPNSSCNYFYQLNNGERRGEKDIKSFDPSTSESSARIGFIVSALFVLVLNFNSRFIALVQLHGYSGTKICSGTCWERFPNAKHQSISQLQLLLMSSVIMSESRVAHSCKSLQKENKTSTPAHQKLSREDEEICDWKDVFDDQSNRNEEQLRIQTNIEMASNH